MTAIRRGEKMPQYPTPATQPSTPTDDDWNDNVDVSTLTVAERLDWLQREVEALKQRNFEKDRGKEFESSYTRVIFLMVVTYWTLFGYMAIIKTANPFLDAIVPTVGFNISTWSLPYVKEWWIRARHYYRHGESEAASLQRREREREESAAARSCSSLPSHQDGMNPMTAHDDDVDVERQQLQAPTVEARVVGPSSSGNDQVETPLSPSSGGY